MQVRRDYVLSCGASPDGRLDFEVLKSPQVALDASVFLQAPESEAAAPGIPVISQVVGVGQVGQVVSFSNLRF